MVKDLDNLHSLGSKSLPNPMKMALNEVIQAIVIINRKVKLSTTCD